MKLVAGIDIGNATTETALARIEELERRLEEQQALAVVMVF